MNTNIAKLVSSIIKGTTNDIRSLVSSVIASKTSKVLKEKKAEVAKEMFPLKKKVKNLKEDVLVDIQKIVDDNQLAKVKLNNDEIVDVDAATANVLLTVLNALDDEHKQQMLELLSSNAKNFLKVVDFSWQHVE